jgi:hypothetical protein
VLHLRKDDNVQIVCPKYDIERKSTKNRATQVNIEDLESVGRRGDEVNQVIQLIEKSDRGASAFAQLTRRQLRRRPGALPEGNGQTFASAVQSAAELTTNLVPSERLNGTRIEIPNAHCDLASPGLFGVFIDLGVEAVNQRVGERRPCCRGQFQSVH